ncbi:hypothetical protein EV207_101326 [Scopulibacillus darangshiensis]|uniref:HD domain-containing protein n=1 Tax=Scopulibacillus darangshiensis TaxID=442528 RepID=A0A4R2PBH7_9BACL|nr:HD family phosphohydrolase [Scopulibacillus darangshiensis]TCP32347.1 hypothetical protein EV207_101326 [Scopulibacillus darangshiensis]
MKRLPFVSIIERFRLTPFSAWMIYLLLGVVMYLLMINSVTPKKIDVTLHEIAKNDIQSPVEVVDQQATEAQRQEALASAPSSYVYNKNEALIQVEKAGDIFDVISEIKKKAKNSSEKNTGDHKPPSLDGQVKAVKDKLAKPAGNDLSNNTIESLLTTSERELTIAQDITSTAIYEAMSNKIKWSDLERVQNKASASLPSSVLNDELRHALTDVLHYAIVPNYVFDADATKRNKEEAAKSVDNVVIHQGEVIVKKGELVTRDVMHKLKVVGLLDDHFNIIPFIGLAVMVAFLTTLIVFECRHLKEKKGKKFRPVDLWVYSVIFIFMLLLIKLDSYLIYTHITGMIYVIPLASGTLLIRMFFTERMAIVTSIILSLSGSLIFGGENTAAVFDVQMGLYLLLTSLAGALVLRGNETRPRILRAGVIIAGVNVLTVLCLLMLQNSPFHVAETGLNIGLALLSGFLSAVLTIGLVPFFEATFGILSTMKLIELSNPNHPLLRKVLIDAPGTYHHSVMVANLAERACEVIGANGLLARVAAYYHDIGKTKRPHFFIENQFNHVNPHDKISPQLSRTIIISHPYDGADMLREHRMPKEIIDIAEQHHGTSLLKYFYIKAQEATKQDIPESEFRYPGPKVQTKEAAVVELADSIEAAVRSMAKPTPVKIESLVQKIFNEKLEDGQFDECNLTLNELKLVRESIFETIKGMFHSRIEYPDEVNRKKVTNE